MILERVDYQKLYGKVTNKNFIKTLQLGFDYGKIIPLLYEQRDDENPFYIPDLQVEGLVHENNSPYQAMRGLHELNRRKIITYGITEPIIPEPGPSALEGMLFTPVIEKAVEQGVVEEYKEPKQYTTGLSYRRIAMFNLEYPVVYFCLQEEKSISKVVDGVLYEFYDAIYTGTLAEALHAREYPMILEFLNFMQTMFQQPLTEVKRNEADEAEERPADIPGSRGLVGGIQPDRTGPEIQQAPLYSVEVEENRGLEEGHRRSTETESQVDGAGEQQGFARIDEVDLSKVGLSWEAQHNQVGGNSRGIYR